MMKQCTSNCNCIECIWERVIYNQGKILLTKQKKKVSFKVENDMIVWISKEATQATLYPQSKSNICSCLKARLDNIKTTEYPGTAQSYKWALLNDEDIWQC